MNPPRAFLGQRESRTALVEASGLLDSPVRNTEGTDMGEVKQLLINPNDGQIAYAVVAVGDTAGFGETSIAIPWKAVKVAQDKRAVVLTVKREVLEKAPRVEEGRDFQITGSGEEGRDFEILGSGTEPQIQMENQ